MRLALRLPGGRRALQRLLLGEDGALLHDVLWRPLLEGPPSDDGEIRTESIFGPNYTRLLEFLSAEDFALLRAFVDRAGDDVLREMVLDHAALLRSLLEEDHFSRFVTMAHQDNAKALRAALDHDGGATLRALLAENDYARYRNFAQSADNAPLKAVLFEENYTVLKRLLALNGHEALKAVALEGDPAIFPMIARTREGKPLAALLFDDNAALLRHLCRLQGDDALLPVLEEDGPRYLHGLPDNLRNQFAGQLLREGAQPSEGALQKSPALLAQVSSMPRVLAMAALNEKWAALEGIVAKGRPEILVRFQEGLDAIRSPEHVRGRILDAITEGDLVHLAHGSLQFPCRHSLWTLIHEILLNEDYFFECDNEAPVIIDGGAHMGMAIYYFKALYPNARIIAFEPESTLRAMAEANCARNCFSDVTVLPYALAGERKEATFHVSEKWTMAGSLSPHRASLGEELHEVNVNCVPLSEYLDGPVDFLKLDIEGAEDEVLEEAAPKLGNVKHLFCEFHDGPGLATGRLAKILGILDTAGFDVQVAKSHNYQDTSRTRPLTHFGGAVSQIIWAVRRI